MVYDPTNRLVVGVASSALSDLTESDAFFKDHGEAAYPDCQDEHIDDTLRSGVAFPHQAVAAVHRPAAGRRVHLTWTAWKSVSKYGQVRPRQPLEPLGKGRCRDNR